MDSKYMDYKCRVCSNSVGNRIHIASEHVNGIGDRFEYVECAHCGCVQIVEPPANMQKYYAKDYYSFKVAHIKRSCVTNFINKQIFKHRVGHFAPLGAVICAFSGKFNWVKRGMFDMQSSILDVGCGAGERILEMHDAGFKNVSGVDPYIQSDIEYGNGVQVLKKDIDTITKRFDVVMLHHSLEHIFDQQTAMNQLHKILNPGGVLLIRIPIVGCYSWRKYGVHAYNFVVPHHFAMHTPFSLNLLACQAGFRLQKVTFEPEKSSLVSQKYQYGYGAGREFHGLSVMQKVRFKLMTLFMGLNYVNDSDGIAAYFRKE